MTTKSKTQDKHKMSEIDENISKLFDIKKRLGKGAYGIVWKALDKRTNETLAVKKIFDAFRDETDAQRTFREIIFLKAFRNHPNVIKLNNVYKASNNLDIYLIFEYMESDLHNIIKKGTILKDIHKRYVMYQLINAIKYIHSGNVIHRDLKPSNVLIDSKCRCKLADFGLARSVSNRPMRDGSDIGSDPVVEPILTDYVATRWYRAPEILVASKSYTKGIDMWSLGCILGEMIRGKPLFQGSSTINQIEKIVTALPEITDRDINAVGAGFGSVLLIKQISTERKTTLDDLLEDAPDDATNLVKSLLVLDPLARLTAKQALCHSYVEKFRNSIPEIELNMDVLPPFRDDVRLSVPEYRSKLYEIVQVPGEKSNVQRTTSGVKSIISNKIRDKKKEYHDKSDMLQKTTSTKHSQKHETLNFISKEQYLIKAESNDQEAVHANNVAYTAARPLKKAVSPMPKRKLTKISKSHPGEQLREASQTIEKVTLMQAKAKLRPKVNDHMDDAMKMYNYEKRHSVDGGYGSLPATVKQSPINSMNSSAINLAKPKNSDRIHRSSSSHHRSDYIPHNRVGDKEVAVEQHERYNRSTPVVGLDNKSIYVRNTKSDVIPPATKNHERICYEKRLKKLEEEIEKYKKEVKSFCKDSCQYTSQSDALKTPTAANGHSKHHGELKHSGVGKTGNLYTMLSNGSGLMSTSKKNHYYQLLSNKNKELGKNSYDELLHSTGGSGDHIDRSTLDIMKGNQRVKHENNHRSRPMSKFI